MQFATQRCNTPMHAGNSWYNVMMERCILAFSGSEMSLCRTTDHHEKICTKHLSQTNAHGMAIADCAFAGW